MFTDITQPNLADFSTFVYAQGVTTAALPTNSTYLQWSLDYATNVAIDPGGAVPQISYIMAVYNLGMHHLIKTTPDQGTMIFFSALRTQYKLLTFIAGPPISTGDNGTNTTLASPEWLKNMTISASDYLKTPWGCEYLAYAQSYGPNIVDVS